MDSSGRVLSSQLPSYVDDVIEGYYSASQGKFYWDSTKTEEMTGETGKIYVGLGDNRTYRWSGSVWVEISQSLALGETSSTAYRGDYGKIAYTHSQSAHAPSDAEKNVIISVKKNGTELTVDSSRAVDIVFDEHSHDNKDVLDSITAIDTELSSTSTNPVQNKAIYETTNDIAAQITANENNISTLSTRVDALSAAVGASESWAMISKLTSAGEASTAFAIGDQLAENWTITYNSADTLYTDVPMNIVHFSDSEEMQTGTDDDGNVTTETTKGMFLQWAYAPPVDLPFDAPEAMYDVPEGGMAAGTYYFQIANSNKSDANGKFYSFTLESDLTEGEQLVLGGTAETTDFTGVTMKVYASPTTFTASATLALTEVTEDTAEGTYLGATDGTGDVNHLLRMSYGYNRYKNSAIRQWLNSSAVAGAWWTKQGKWDRAPSALNTYAGFLAGYSTDFIAAMKPIKVQQSTNTVTDSGVADVMYDKVFLPSLEQMYIKPQVSGVEGEAWEFYKQLSAANGRTSIYALFSTYTELKSYSLNAKTSSCHVRLRSAMRAYVPGAWCVIDSGYVTYGVASAAWRVRPACFV